MSVITILDCSRTIEPAVGNQSTGKNRFVSAINIRRILQGPTICTRGRQTAPPQLARVPGVEVAPVVLVIVVQAVVDIPGAL